MTKIYVFTMSPHGTSTVSVASEEIAIKLCIYAIGLGAHFAFYSR